MSKRLSICIAVQNAQATLHESVSRLLEVTSELTNDFELVIVDNGSTDATTEAAHELALQYPQVRVITNRARLGHAAALRRALARTTGDILIFPEREGQLDLSGLRTIWADAEGNDAVFCPRSKPRHKHRSLASHLFARAARKRRSSWRHGRLRLASSFQAPQHVEESEVAAPLLVRHEVLERLGWIPLERGELMAAATSHGYHWSVASSTPRSLAPWAEQDGGEMNGASSEAEDNVRSRRASGPGRPNYLDQIKRFALEE